MIVPVPWRSVPADPAGVRVILSSGRIVRALSASTVGDLTAVVMANPDGRRANAVVRADDVVPMVYDEQDAALAALKQSFGHVEFLREI